MTQGKFSDIMLDIETMGNESFSSIISIGAVEFDIETGETGREFYVNIDLQSCIDAGLKINASTVMWWMQQSEEARKELVERESSLIFHVLSGFSQFMMPWDENLRIWGNSAAFDCGILRNAYEKLRMKAPWEFWQEMDVRTLARLRPEIKKNFQFQGVQHSPIADCKFQIGYCCEIWKSLNSGL